jgi:phosphoenolpyruvate phosphomutase
VTGKLKTARTDLPSIGGNGARQGLHTSKCAKLRALLGSPQLEFAMEAHNGVSARIVEQAGFKGLWASGLAISAQFCVRDNNEASWTQVVDMLEFMSDVTSIPILLDGDTGYGDFNNMRRLVHKLEQRGIAGVCIEDKQYPKTNSFIAGERQRLADVEEFCGKIKAGKDSQTDPSFSIVARVEALIAGWGLDEALRRAEAYHEAGADAILIHSKRSHPGEILAFAKEWARRLPLVIVPTKYYSTPTDVFRRAGVGLIIWANHMIRAAIAAMKTVAHEVHATETLVNVEDRIAPLAEVFHLQGADELVRAEQRYFHRGGSRTHAVVLAASRGRELKELTADRPKVMLPVAGKPLLRRLVDEFNKQAIHDVTVVAGYKAEVIEAQGIKLVANPEHDTTGELTSLAHAQAAFADDMVILYGDLLFRSHVLRDLLEHDGELVAVVDSALNGAHLSGSADYAYCSASDDRSLFQNDVHLLAVSASEPSEDVPSGRWIGMLRVRGKGRRWLEEGLAALRGREDFPRLGMPELINHLIGRGWPIKVHYINGHWLDINRLDDLDRAGRFAQGQVHFCGLSE